MKFKIYALLCWVFCLLGACSDFTEIDPKGRNTLNKVEDLNLLLNSQYESNLTGLSTFIADIYPNFSFYIPDYLNEAIPSSMGVTVTWNESADRGALTQTDGKYTNLYEIIGQIANPVLLNVDQASGNRTLAAQYKAEALVLRAWCHYLLVNIYAKAYVPETADSDPGIVYAKETDDIATPNEKLSVARIYELILEDLNAALELNSLPVNPGKMRVGLPFAYAVKAKVLMSMRDYEGAFSAAGKSLELKSVIDDYNDKLVSGLYAQMVDMLKQAGMGEMFEMLGIPADVDVRGFARGYLSCEEELFETPMVFYTTFTSEWFENLEENHIYRYHLLTDERLRMLNLSYLFEMIGMPVPNMSETNLGITGSPFYLYDAYTSLYFSPLGLTTVDMRLVQAECHIRKGEIAEGMKMLNLIREKRIITGKYRPETASTPEEAFTWLKKISRTESIYTPKHFINLKRWNTEEKYRETLHKTFHIAGTESTVRSYSLAPDSPLWIFPFPQDASGFNPNLTQNY